MNGTPIAMDGVAFFLDGATCMGSWIDQELAGCKFADERLGKRFGVLMKQLSQGIGRTIPLACGDWASTKAAYRFVDNDRVSEGEILAGHFKSTRNRFTALDGPVLVLHDTTEFSFTREDAQAIGQNCSASANRWKRTSSFAHAWIGGRKMGIRRLANTWTISASRPCIVLRYWMPREN
jgi:hypothetical protein